MRLQYHGSGEGLQTVAAGALAGAEIQIATRDREARDHPETTTVSPAEHTGPSDLYVPQTGRTVPNLPTVSGSGRGGVETFQDRAMRCSHQAGVFGQTAGDRGSYMGACLNQ
jgi:hypothetical protein